MSEESTWLGWGSTRATARGKKIYSLTVKSVANQRVMRFICVDLRHRAHWICCQSTRQYRAGLGETLDRISN